MGEVSFETNYVSPKILKYILNMHAKLFLSHLAGSTEKT